MVVAVPIPSPALVSIWLSQFQAYTLTFRSRLLSASAVASAFFETRYARSKRVFGLSTKRYLPLALTTAVPTLRQLVPLSYFAWTTTLLPSGGFGVTVPLRTTLSSLATATFVDAWSVTLYGAVGAGAASATGTVRPAPATARPAIETARRVDLMMNLRDLLHRDAM